ncbi:hypothetical protein O0544_03440 [Edwardsiella anguillarum]|nr:hypothetical protein [Edwardsiella anguillarum]
MAHFLIGDFSNGLVGLGADRRDERAAQAERGQGESICSGKA